MANRKLKLSKQVSQQTPLSKKRVSKGRVLFTATPKRIAPMKKKSAASTSTQPSPAPPASSVKGNLTVRRKAQALQADAIFEPTRTKPCTVPVVRFDESVSENGNMRNQHSGSVSSKRKAKVAKNIDNPAQKKRRRRRRRITALHAVTVNSKNPKRTLSEHLKYCNLLPQKIKIAKKIHEKSCTSGLVVALEQLDDEVLQRYVKLRGLSTKKDEDLIKMKGKVMLKIENCISELQQTIQKTKNGRDEERSSLFKKSGVRECCHFCYSLSSS